MVPYYAVPGLQVLSFKGVETLRVLRVEVVDEAVHDTEEDMHDGVVAAGLLVGQRELQ